MLTPQEIINTHLLATRRSIIEIAEVLDAYDAAVARAGREAPSGERVADLRKAMALLAEPGPSQSRRDRLIDLFAARQPSSRPALAKPQSVPQRSLPAWKPVGVRRSFTD